MKRPHWVEQVRSRGLRVDTDLLDRLTASIEDDARRHKATALATSVKRYTKDGFYYLSGAPTAIEGRYALFPLNLAREQRAAVIPSSSAYVFLTIDWVGAEVTAAAFLAGQTDLLERLDDDAFDVFTFLGTKLAIDRKAAKEVLFGYLYGRHHHRHRDVSALFPKMAVRKAALSRREHMHSIHTVIGRKIQEVVPRMLAADLRVVMVHHDSVIIEVKRGSPINHAVDLMRTEDPRFRVRSKLSENWA